MKQECTHCGLLANSIRDLFKLLDDRILVRNTENDHNLMAFLEQGRTITTVLKASQDALLPSTEPSRIETMERLLKEARSLMLDVGESMEVPIHVPQHGWLKEVNEMLPLPEKQQ